MYYGTPIQGYGVNNCNTLALWSARAIRSLALDAFNAGDYYRAVEEEVESETVTKVLYPNDEPEAGKQLRLLQQHFFVVLTAGHPAPDGGPRRGGRPDAARAGGRAAQRHAPVDRGGRS